MSKCLNILCSEVAEDAKRLCNRHSNPAASLTEKKPITAHPKLESAVAMGHMGGKARAEALSKSQRVEIAKIAAAVRWKKTRVKSNPKE